MSTPWLAITVVATKVEETDEGPRTRISTFMRTTRKHDDVDAAIGDAVLKARADMQNDTKGGSWELYVVQWIECGTGRKGVIKGDGLPKRFPPMMKEQD